jgi:hypothetical protein
MKSQACVTGQTAPITKLLKSVSFLFLGLVNDTVSTALVTLHEVPAVMGVIWKDMRASMVYSMIQYQQLACWEQRNPQSR